MYIHALVTIVLERAWAALKCDQLPVNIPNESGPLMPKSSSFKIIQFSYLLFHEYSLSFWGGDNIMMQSDSKLIS